MDELSKEERIKALGGLIILAIVLSACVIIEELNITGWKNVVRVITIALLLIFAISHTIRQIYPDDA